MNVSPNSHLQAPQGQCTTKKEPPEEDKITKIVQKELSLYADISRCLVRAAKHDETKRMQRLLGLEDLDVNAIDGKGMTALCYACKNGNMDAIKSLVHKKADINKGYSINAAAFYGHLDAVKYLLDQGAQGNLLLNAVNGNSEKVVEFLLEKIISVKHHPYVYRACFNKNPVIAKMLLEKEMSPNTTHNDISPLEVAVRKNSLELVQLLFNHGVNVSTYILDQLLRESIRKNQSEMVKILLQNGADLRRLVNRNLRHLLRVYNVLNKEAYDYTMKKVIIEFANLTRDLSTSFLYAAVRGGDLTCVAMLLDRNADCPGYVVSEAKRRRNRDGDTRGIYNLVTRYYCERHSVRSFVTCPTKRISIMRE